MDLSFLMSLIGLLGGLWLYLYKTITDLTVSNPADSSLVILGLVHYAVLGYLVLTLYLFYHRGLPTASSSRIKKRIEIANAIVLETWPLTLVGLILAFLISKSFQSGFALKLASACIVLIGVGVPVFNAIRQRKITSRAGLSTGLIVSFFIMIGITGIPYFFVMSFFLSGVQITTDKEFYAPGENVIVSIRPSGYIFRPTLKSVTAGFLYQDKTSGNDLQDDETIAISSDKLSADHNLIEVEFEPQLIGKVGKAFHEVKIAKKAAGP
jgi:hypothetical protein